MESDSTAASSGSETLILRIACSALRRSSLRLTSKKFQEALRTAVLDTLRTPEGQELLTKAIRKELANRQK